MSYIQLPSRQHIYPPPEDALSTSAILFGEGCLDITTTLPDKQ